VSALESEIYDELLSSFAFNFNLRRYITGGAVADYETVDGVTALVTAVRFNCGMAVQVDPVTPTLKAPRTEHVETIT
jgi:hypothetical protein